jgi:hypothetical protein
MASSRIGIELSPVACRIVEVSASAFDQVNPADTRVASFSASSPGTAAPADVLEPLRRRRANVVVWGVPSAHLQVMVTKGKYDAMRAEAVRSARDVGTATDGMLADIAPGTIADEGDRRSVLVVLGAAERLRLALQPLVDAGVRIASVATPADALAALARLRRALSSPDAVEAYVALEETAICIALVRNGRLLAGKELDWGFLDGDASVRPREEVAERLAADVADFLTAVGSSQRSVSQVSICGGMPELRSMSVLLTDRLDIEVEPLDSLFNIDAANLPEEPPDFRERLAELRIAWAVAVERPIVIDLLRDRHRRAARTRLARAAVAAGIVAGLGLGWQLERSGRLPELRTSAARPEQTTARASTPVPPEHAALDRTVQAPAPIPPTQPMPSPSPMPTPDARNAGSSREAPAVVAEKPSAPLSASKPSNPSNPSGATSTPSTAATAAQRSTASSAPASSTSTAPADASRRNQVKPNEPPATTSGNAVGRAAAPASPPRPTTSGVDVRTPTRESSAPAPLPFDAVLQTILYSPDRQLAMVDGRIVAIGDSIKDARVVEITATTVLLRDGQGRLRRLAVGGP